MSEQNKNPKPAKIEIELKEDEVVGTYSNLVMITHSPSEFILDFIAVMPGAPKAKVVKRMILTPDHAKRFAGALAENVKRYEQEHGTIQIKNRVEVPMYRGPIPEA